MLEERKKKLNYVKLGFPGEKLHVTYYRIHTVRKKQEKSMFLRTVRIRQEMS